MIFRKRKCIIFDSCKQLFPLLDLGLDKSKDANVELELIAGCENDHNLKVSIEDYEPLKGQFRVRLFVEFELEEQIRRHPSFVVNLDYANQRAEVLSFESNLYPHIRLDVYTEVDGRKYKNVVAEKDLTTLFTSWLKQLKELNYKLQWQEQKQTA